MVGFRKTTTYCGRASSSYPKEDPPFGRPRLVQPRPRPHHAELSGIIDGLTAESINRYLAAIAPRAFSVVTIGQQRLTSR